MQRWGGILFYTFLSEPSLPRLLMHNASSVSNRFLRLVELKIEQISPRTFFLLRTICWLVHWLYYYSSISVEFRFRRKVRTPPSVDHWLMCVLIICSSTCLGMGLRWFFEPSNKPRSEVKCEVWIVVVKVLFPCAYSICWDFLLD